MQKTLTIILLACAALWGLSSCEGAYMDPGAMGMMGGGGLGGLFGGDHGEDDDGSSGKGSSGGGSSSGSSGGSSGGSGTWSKLTAGTGTWVSTECVLRFFVKEGKNRVDIRDNLADDHPWEQMVSVSGNTLNIGGGSFDTLTVAFTSSDTVMTLSNGKSDFAKDYEGTYMKY